MRKTISRSMSVTTLFLIFFGISCSSLALSSPPALPNRTLRISPDLPGFEYQYRVCAKKILGVCVKHKMKKEIYDLRDEAVRKQLIDMGFVARRRDL